MFITLLGGVIPHKGGTRLGGISPPLSRGVAPLPTFGGYNTTPSAGGVFSFPPFGGAFPPAAGGGPKEVGTLYNN
jgi:hypothetical protein